jgi:phosphoglycolate phosphatase
MSETKRTPTAILWDWDGTLVDSFETIRQAYNAARKAYGMEPWSLEETYRNVALSGRDAFPQMFGANADAALKIYYDTYNRLAPTLVRPKAGRADLLRRLAGSGLPMAVVSNKRGDLLRAECNGLGWAGFFKALVGAGDAATDKPTSAPMRLAAGQGGFSLRSTAVYIGDAPIDGETAANAGVSAILLAGETHAANDLEKLSFQKIIVNFNELEHLLIQTS